MSDVVKQCSVCGNTNNNKIYKVKERMLNKGEEFRYLLCQNCGTLQLFDTVGNMGKYYENYLIFKLQPQKIRGLDKIFIDVLLSKGVKVIKFLLPIRQEIKFIEPLIGTGIKKSHKILDVGCGNGIWLQQLKELGFDNLYGVDKYVPDNMLNSEYKFYKGEIHDIENESFDFITLHHSFEHMNDPKEVLEKIYSMLKSTGVCIIRIPVMGKLAWRKYKTSWYQIDAPRHIFLYTEYAIKELCKSVGLEVFDIKYDSTYNQFLVSEQYGKTKKSMIQISKTVVNRSKIKKYEKWAKSCNRKKDGDQAIFYIRKQL